jgi:hypothetical protein
LSTVGAPKPKLAVDHVGDPVRQAVEFRIGVAAAALDVHQCFEVRIAIRQLACGPGEIDLHRDIPLLRRAI